MQDNLSSDKNNAPEQPKQEISEHKEHCKK